MRTKKLTFKNYIELSKLINSFDDLKLTSVRIIHGINYYYDSDFDAVYGKQIEVVLNGIKFDWFEANNIIIASAILLENEMHYERIKNRVLNILSNRLYLCHIFKIDFNDEKLKNITNKFSQYITKEYYG